MIFRWSLTFQTYVQLTMLQNHTLHTEKPGNICCPVIGQICQNLARILILTNSQADGEVPALGHVLLCREPEEDGQDAGVRVHGPHSLV